MSPPGEIADPAQLAALVATPSSTRSSSRSAGSAFDDPKGIELGQEYVKLAVQEMPIIPLMSYNVFTMMDDTYWTGYPTRGGSVHQSGAELGKLALHDGEAEARSNSGDPSATAGGSRWTASQTLRPEEPRPVRSS